MDFFKQVVLQYKLSMLDFLKDRKHGDHSVVASFLEDEGFSLRQAALLTRLSLSQDLVKLNLGHHAIQLIEHHAVFPVLSIERLLKHVSLQNVLTRINDTGIERRLGFLSQDILH